MKANFQLTGKKKERDWIFQGNVTEIAQVHHEIVKVYSW